MFKSYPIYHCNKYYNNEFGYYNNESKNNDVMKFYRKKYHQVFRPKFKINYIGFTEDMNKYIPKKKLSRKKIIEIEKKDIVQYNAYRDNNETPELN